MVDILAMHDCQLISTSESIDTTTAMGRIFFTMCSAINECESDKTSERVKIGMERAKSEGKDCNRPPKKLSAYQIEKAKTILANDPQISRRELSKQFEGISRPTLIKCLRGEELIV